MRKAAAIPTESFYVANDRIMAAVCGGQLTTDHHFGLSAFHAPWKDSSTLIQSTRVQLLVDGAWAGALEDDAHGTIAERGYEQDTLAVRILWREHGVEVEERWFVPPDTDVVAHQIRVRNVAAAPRPVKFFAILYPQLGSPVPHKKGICKTGLYDESGCILIEDLKGNVLVFGMDAVPAEFQVGEVCAPTDVYYDIEDHALSGNASVANATPNAALALDLGDMAPDTGCTITLFLARADSVEDGVVLYRRILQEHASYWNRHAAYCADVLARAHAPALEGDFGPRLERLIRRSVLVLRSILRPDGSPMGGIHCYQNVGQVRNGSYILSVLDRLGFHGETRGGYEFYLKFRVGDPRFSSPDENDQLGTVLHVIRQRSDQAGDVEWVASNRSVLFRMADRLLALIDPRCGLIYSERAIHEFVAISRGYETYVNTMAWRGLTDAAILAARLGCEAESRRYAEASVRLRAAVLRHLVDPGQGVFVKRLHRGRHDALPAVSALTPALFGLVDARSEVVTRTIAHLIAHLWDRTIGGLYRYPLHLQPWPEHPYGGPWVTYTCWLARVYLLRREKQKAEEIIRWVLEHVPEDSDLIPEHFSVGHHGRRGFHRIYLEPATPEIWATAEFLRLVLDFKEYSP